LPGQKSPLRVKRKINYLQGQTKVPSESWRNYYFGKVQEHYFFQELEKKNAG
jgi:hypothetical protein